MKVWVVESNSWNGEHDSVSVHDVYASETAARDFCDRMNKERLSSYSTSYECSEFKVKE